MLRFNQFGRPMYDLPGGRSPAFPLGLPRGSPTCMTSAGGGGGGGTLPLPAICLAFAMESISMAGHRWARTEQFLTYVTDLPGRTHPPLRL